VACWTRNCMTPPVCRKPKQQVNLTVRTTHRSSASTPHRHVQPSNTAMNISLVVLMSGGNLAPCTACTKTNHPA
jgi:hypothetical protein